MFYKVKMIRKGTKPPVWRRAFIPSGITFTQLAVLLMEMLETGRSDSYEIEFYHERKKFIEAGVINPYHYLYSFYNASRTYVDDYFDEEEWFTFRFLSDIAPEYRIELEDYGDVVEKDGPPLDHPVIIKQNRFDYEEYWGDPHDVNITLAEKFRLKKGAVQYKTFAAHAASVDKGKGLIYSTNPKNGDNIIKESAIEIFRKIVDSSRVLDQLNTRTDEIREKYGIGNPEDMDKLDPAQLQELNDEVSELSRELSQMFSDEVEEILHGKGRKAANNDASPSRRYPTIEDMMKNFTGKELALMAEEYGLEAEKKAKRTLIYELTRYLLDASNMKRLLLPVSAESLDLFEKVISKGIYMPANDEEEEVLEDFTDDFYIAIYDDGYAEVPEDVALVYNILKKNGFRETHRKVLWMIDCLLCFSQVQSVAPFDVLYQMFRQKEKDAVIEECRKIFDMVPDEYNPCVIKDGKIILKVILKNNLYLKLEKDQRKIDYYIPSEKEISELATDFYPLSEKNYIALRDFFVNEMRLDIEDSHSLCAIAFHVFSMGGLLSDYMDEVNEYFKEDAFVFKNDKQLERFSLLITRVINNTRQHVLRGHTPNEASMLMKNFPRSVAPSIAPLNSASANMLKESQQALKRMGISIDLDSTSDEYPVINFPSGIKGEAKQSIKKIYPNDPCPCGSGKKYKHCCGKK